MSSETAINTIDKLTTAEFKTLLDEYFAPPEKRTKMSDEEIKDLAKRLNERIDVPIISETGEEKILIKIVFTIDRFLYDNLPNEFYDLTRCLDKGIDNQEARRLIKRLSKLANANINIPYIPEKVEYIAIRFIIGIIINAARKKWNLLLALENANKMKTPGGKAPTERDLEAIVS